MLKQIKVTLIANMVASRVLKKKIEFTYNTNMNQKVASMVKNIPMITSSLKTPKNTL